MITGHIGFWSRERVMERLESFLPLLIGIPLARTPKESKALFVVFAKKKARWTMTYAKAELVR